VREVVTNDGAEDAIYNSDPEEAGKSGRHGSNPRQESYRVGSGGRLRQAKRRAKSCDVCGLEMLGQVFWISEGGSQPD